MPGVTITAHARGAFTSAPKTLTFTTPVVLKGDVMLIVVARNSADARGATPTGWTFGATLGSGADTLDYYARMVDDNEPTSIVFSLPTVANEWHGELVALRGTSSGIVVEASASATFSGAALATAGVTSQQAISLILVVFVVAGIHSLTLPAGFTSIDNFNTAVVSSRTAMIGYKIAGATGALTFPNGASEDIATGRSFTFVLRDRVPTTPAALVDLVPGNIGLIGKDTRPAR